MFNLDEARQELRADDKLDLTCLFISKDYQLKKVIIEKTLKVELINSYKDKFIFITNDKKIIEYDPIVKLDDCIDSISVSDISTLTDIKERFDDITTIDSIDEFKDIEGSKAYAIVLSNNDKNIKFVFFRRFSPSSYLKNKCKILFEEGRLKKINKNILSIDDRFDCVMYKDEMVIFTQLYFEQIFDYKDEYTKRANENISKIRNLNVIENIEDIENECEKITIKKKLAKIKDENIEWFKNKINNDFKAIENIINKVGLDMKIKNGQIISNDTSELIHLIQDDYLKSDLSGDNYVTDKKTKL